MFRLFFLELPLSILTAAVGAYTSYIVTVGVLSNISNSPSIIFWLVSAIILVVSLIFLKSWVFLKNKVVLKELVFKYIPALSFLVGAFALIAGVI